jgi:hypothetical protein
VSWLANQNHAHWQLQAAPAPVTIRLMPGSACPASMFQMCSCARSALPVTARSLEALIRLSQAHAKLHLADRVEAVDVHAASR